MKKSAVPIRFGIAVIGIVILVAIVFSKVIFNSDRLSALVLPKISQLLNRTVSAEQVELSFFPTIGIRITGLRVANPGYGRFDSPFLLDTKAVVIDAKILPLLKNRLEINNVIFYSPTLYLEQNAKGKFNTEQLLSDSFYKGSRNVRGSLSSLLLSNFEIANGNIIFYDSRTGISAKFLNLDFGSRIQTVVEENKLTLNSRLKVDRFEFWKGTSDLFDGNQIEVGAKLDYDKRHDQVNIQAERATVFGLELISSVSLSFYPRTEINVSVINSDSSAHGIFNLLPNFLQEVIVQNSVRGNLALEFRYAGRDIGTDAVFYLHLRNFYAELKSGDSLSVRELKSTYFLRNDSSAISFSMPSAALGENFASISFNLSPPQSAVARILVNVELKKLAHSFGMPDVDRFSGAVKARCNLDYNSRTHGVIADGLVSFADALIQIPIGIDTLYSGEFDGSVSLKNKYATFNKLLVRLGASDLVLTGTLTDYQNVILGGKMPMPSLRLNVVSKTFSTIGLLPHMNLIIGRQSLAWLPRGNVRLDFKIGKFFMPSDTISKVAGSFQLFGYYVKLTKLNYMSSMGDFWVSGWTDYGQEGKTTFGMKAKITTTNLGRLVLRYLGRPEIIGGSGKGFLTLNGAYDDSGRVDLATLGGRGQWTISNVTLKSYSVLDKLYDFLGAKGRDSVRLQDASLAIDVTDGRVYFDKLTAYGVPLDFKLGGWHGFDGTLDYKLALRIYPPVSLQMIQHLAGLYPDLSPSRDAILSLEVVAGGTTSDSRFTIVGLNTRFAENRNAPPNYVSSLR